MLVKLIERRLRRGKLEDGMRDVSFEAKGFTLAEDVRRLDFAARSLGGQICAELIEEPAEGSTMTWRQMNAQPGLHRQHERALAPSCGAWSLGSSGLESEGAVINLGRYNRPPGRQMCQVRPSIWHKTIEAATAWESAASAETDVLDGERPDSDAAKQRFEHAEAVNQSLRSEVGAWS